MKIIQKLIFIFAMILVSNWVNAQEVRSKNSLKLDLAGRVQLQHVYNDNLSSADSITSHGFRMRRVRVQLDAKITDFLLSKIQIEVRDNSPRLKDAEGKLLLFNNYYFRFGQFKVPVWREEFLRSSGDLILVERSTAAEFLLINLLSARQIGIEAGGNLSSKFSFALNYSNGSGEGMSEIEKLVILQGHTLSPDINNGKMLTGRVDISLNKKVQLGLSGAVNQLGSRVDTLNNKGKNTVLAPDFGIYLPAGFDMEGGIAFGSISKSFIKALENQDYLIADITGRWKKMFTSPLNQWGGMSGFEIAAGVFYINIDSNELGERNSYRFGPALYFAKKTRLQTNLEIVDPVVKEEDMFWRIRSQFTLNF
jgi:hypothetical protein